MATDVVTGEFKLDRRPAPEPSTRATIVGEIVGSFLLSTLGLGIGAAAAVYGGQAGATWFGDIVPTSLGWALCIALGIYCTASLSGAHFNPALTVALAATGRHPWSQVPRYIVCQILGWFLGAAVVVTLFGSNIKRLADRAGVSYGDPGSESIASILTTYVPNPGVFGTGDASIEAVPIGVGFLGEVLGTAILLLVILSLLETRHANAPASWFFPLVVGATVGILIMMFGGLSQASFNPARDLGPRLMLLFMGFGTVAFPGPRGGLALMVTTIGPIVGALVGAWFHDYVMRPNIPGAPREPLLKEPGQLAREPVREVGTLLGHTLAMPVVLDQTGQGTGPGDIDLIMLDAGGAIYDDNCFAQALLRATRELAGGRFDERAFWHLFDEARQNQSPLRESLADRFLSGNTQRLSDLAESYVDYAPEAIYPDVRPTLKVLAPRYKLGVASQNDPIVEALRRHGLAHYFSVMATPRTAGASKTEERFWRWVLEQAGVPAQRAIHVGNRLDSDIRPTKGLGMRTIWLLRGESPPAPRVEQLAEPDAVVTSLSGVLNALVGISGARAPM